MTTWGKVEFESITLLVLRTPGKSWVGHLGVSWILRWEGCDWVLSMSHNNSIDVVLNNYISDSYMRILVYVGSLACSGYTYPCDYTAVSTPINSTWIVRKWIMHIDLGNVGFKKHHSIKNYVSNGHGIDWVLRIHTWHRIGFGSLILILLRTTL